MLIAMFSYREIELYMFEGCEGEKLVPPNFGHFIFSRACDIQFSIIVPVGPEGPELEREPRQGLGRADADEAVPGQQVGGRLGLENAPEGQAQGRDHEHQKRFTHDSPSF